MQLADPRSPVHLHPGNPRTLFVAASTGCAACAASLCVARRARRIGRRAVVAWHDGLSGRARLVWVGCRHASRRRSRRVARITAARSGCLAVGCPGRSGRRAVVTTGCICRFGHGADSRRCKHRRSKQQCLRNSHRRPFPFIEPIQARSVGIRRHRSCQVHDNRYL
jgi:hypothetical protein